MLTTGPGGWEALRSIAPEIAAGTAPSTAEGHSLVARVRPLTVRLTAVILPTGNQRPSCCPKGRNREVWPRVGRRPRGRSHSCPSRSRPGPGRAHRTARARRPASGTGTASKRRPERRSAHRRRRRSRRPPPAAWPEGPFKTASPIAIARTSAATTSRYPRPKPPPAGRATMERPGRRTATNTATNASTPRTRSSTATPVGNEAVLKRTKTKPKTAPIMEPSFSRVMARVCTWQARRRRAPCSRGRAMRTGRPAADPPMARLRLAGLVARSD